MARHAFVREKRAPTIPRRLAAGNLYLANLGSEVNRIFVLKEKGLLKEAGEAHARANGIIEKLFSHPELEGRTEEVRMLKDYLEQSFESERTEFLKKEWQVYFSPYVRRLFSASR